MHRTSNLIIFLPDGSPYKVQACELICTAYYSFELSIETFFSLMNIQGNTLCSVTSAVSLTLKQRMCVSNK
jgi:hypothetical protein